MRFAVYGAGGIGAYLGARLADAGHEVHLIARGDHLSALQDEGTTVESINGDTHVDIPATNDPEDVGACDYVLFTVKSYDTKDAAAGLDPLFGDDTAVVSFQNGVDNERWIVDEVGAGHVMGGVAYIFSTIKEPGVVEHTGGPARFVFGELSNGQTERVDALDEALSACDGVESVPVDDVRVELWRKFAFICAQAGMTAATRLPIGPIRETEPTWEMYEGVLEEVCRVARAEGVEVPDGTVREWLDFAQNLDFQTYSSLHYDLVNENRMELDALNGSLVRHATETDVSAPMNRAIYSLLRPWEERNAPG